MRSVIATMSSTTARRTRLETAAAAGITSVPSLLALTETVIATGIVTASDIGTVPVLTAATIVASSDLCLHRGETATEITTSEPAAESESASASVTALMRPGHRHCVQIAPLRGDGVTWMTTIVITMTGASAAARIDHRCHRAGAKSTTRVAVAARIRMATARIVG
jgi:hypothetical protein